jgi:hypothetical protein
MHTHPHAPDTAAAALRLSLARRGLRTAILRDAKAWQTLYDQMRDAYTRAWSDQMREAIAAGLDVIRELGADGLGADNAQAILKALESRVGPEAMAAVLRGPVLDLTDALVRLGAKEVGDAAGVDIAFMRPDLDALALTQDANLFWVANSWNSHTDKLFRDALTDLFRDGMTREQLAARFAQDFAGLSERSIHYWTVVADHTATKTRELGRTSGYTLAGIEEVEVRAQMDEATTEICRAMHGRVISVRSLVDQRSEYLDAVSRRDVPAAKAAWDMHPDPAHIASLPPGAPLPAGLASPPYHFLCRTITVIHIR